MPNRLLTWTKLVSLRDQTKADAETAWVDNYVLKDAEGNPICASGQDGEDGEDGSDGSNGSSGTSAPTPQIKLGKDLSISQDQYGSTINDEDVCLSVDGGKTWVKVSGDNGSSGTGTEGFIINVVDKNIPHRKKAVYPSPHNECMD